MLKGHNPAVQVMKPMNQRMIGVWLTAGLLFVFALCPPARAESVTYSYDALNRLTSVVYGNGQQITYSYDPPGNRTASSSNTLVAPHGFSFTPQTNVALNSPITSNAIIVAGINAAPPISITGGEFSVDGGPYTSAPGNVANGQSVAVRLTSAATYGTLVSATLTIGGVSAAFNVTTASNAASVAGISLSATSLTFSSQPQGGTSGAQSITLTSSGTGTLSITGITASGDFARATNCGATLAAGTNCTIAVTFTPTASGARSGALTISSNAAGSPHSVSLAGTGGAASTTTSIPLLLAQGWNLLGNSLNQTITLSTTFGDPNVVATVWKWDAGQAKWLLYSPLLDAAALQTYAIGKGYGVLSQIAPGDGYWVNAKVAADLGTQTGTMFVLTGTNLLSGWNLVGAGQEVSPSAFNQSLSATPPAPGSVPQNITSLWAWDNPANGWYFYAPSLEAQGGTVLPDYATARGYLDFTQHSKKLGGGAGVWVRKP